ncbi:hypothetical protein QYE76_033827 [Lolium multiflorum]|uniref:TF-B3 domain-containing protein n=1 Tax=Lolium multiflorum TaxID=4521 RepID=A0AAD8QZE8_LOLMU|nr:hypothetical protein QYE76_033827 [Lolium multiflorum]
MYLHTGWDRFARDLALEPGCQLTFLYEGDGEMIVKEEEQEVLFEFVVVLKGDPLGIQKLPDKFADFVAGNEPAVMHLRGVRCDCCRWSLDMLFDGRGKIYLQTGWEKFARYHDLEAGCVLIFSYLGEADMSVKVFNETHCHRHYHGDTDEEDD